MTLEKPIIEKITLTFRDGTVKEMTLENLAEINDMTDFGMEFAIAILRVARMARGKGT